MTCSNYSCVHMLLLLILLQLQLQLQLRLIPAFNMAAFI